MFAAAALCGFAPSGAAQTADFVWIEAQTTATANLKPKVEVWKNALLSGGDFAEISIDAAKVEAELPAEGVVWSYNFNLAKAGKQQIWNRIGGEWVRSPFEWRVDGGAWKTVSPDDLTSDLQELSQWNEIGWLQMGERDLAAGAHKLEIRLSKTLQTQGKDKDKTARVFYRSDALVVAPSFRPNGPFKPDETGRDANDEAAAKNVFQLPEPKTLGGRASVFLNGSWEVARHDEQMPKEVAAPITDFPAAPIWKAIAVPSDKNKARPDLVFAHRLWYRTRVNVPASQIGRSFGLKFPQNSLNTTIYVNGQFCGFGKNPQAPLQFDVTKGIKAGQNEIWVGIKDAWYGFSANPDDPMKLRRQFNRPIQSASGGWTDLSYPVWADFKSGILATPEFFVGGAVYAGDVFVKPSVKNKALNVEITLSNGGKTPASGQIAWQAVNAKSGEVEKTFAPQSFVAAPGDQVVNLSGAWENPKLWWPEANAQLYFLRASVNVGGQPIDVSDTRFGFREWSIDGINFKLNGQVWHGWADVFEAAGKENWLALYRKTNQRFARLWKNDAWQGMKPEEALNWFDENGIVIRRSGLMDGQAIGYQPTETDEEMRKRFPYPEGSKQFIKYDLFENWRDQEVAQVKGERNHPSIQIWSIENEWTFIATQNLGLRDAWDPFVAKVSDAVLAVDPTRPTMIDGGGALKSNSMPVYGDHYVFGSGGGLNAYPDLAYQPNVKAGGRGTTEWDRKKPRYIGEDVFAAGHDTKYSYFGGEAVFIGQQAAKPGVGKAMNVLLQGYRWAEYGAVQFWQTQNVASGQYLSYAPMAVFMRQWDTTFGSGEPAKRTFGIFNDTFHTREPIAFSRTLMLGGKKIWSKTTSHTVLPGQNLKFDEVLAIPTVAARQEGTLLLTLSVGGQEMFRDEKSVSVLPPLGAIAAAKVGPQAKLKIETRALAQVKTQTKAPVSSPKAPAKIKTPFALSAAQLLVFDPNGSASAFLKRVGQPFTALNSLENLSGAAKVLVVGKDALSPQEATSTRLAVYALSGKRVVVLEQTNPLKYAALPADIAAQNNQGRTAFLEDSTHPTLRGLQNADFFTWGDDEVVYRNAYLKPQRGARSLVQVDDNLKNSALLEIPVGKGIMLLSQLVVGEKSASEPVAAQLMWNLLDYAATYKQEYRAVATAISDPQTQKALDVLGLQATKVAGPLQALSDSGVKTALVSATPANLKILAANLAKVKAFNAAGGTLVLCGLTPEGLGDYNKIVGFDHMIRPMRRERVSFPPLKDPLMSGLSLSDVVLYSNESIFGYQSGKYVASDTFSYLVDFDEVAPFATFKNPFYENMVNGMTNADGWKYIVNVPSSERNYEMTFPKAQEISEFTWVGNAFYNLTTRVDLEFDGKEKISFPTAPNTEPQTFEIKPSKTGRVITVINAETTDLPGKNGTIGVDNIYLKARRSPQFYQSVKPMLNIGGLMHYPRGAGGIVLNNILFQETEANPENAGKKRTMLAGILRNLKAPFAGAKTILAGANLTYSPVDISKQANQYRTEKGWFGDSKFTFEALPTGKQTFAGVEYEIYDFPTSPVPTAIMLGSGGIPNNPPTEVKGIPVDRKADALFFLHTMRLDQRLSDDDRKKERSFETARYVVNYADGKSEVVPIIAEVDIDDFKQKSPQALPGAQLAWASKYQGTEFWATAYAKQWNNPRPDVEIRSVDFQYGAQKRGVPVLLAITAATAAK